MNRHLLRVVALSLLSAAIAVAPVRSFAQDNKPATGSKETSKPEKKKRSILPFHGKVSALDNDAKTVTVGKTTYQITSETMLTKGGKPAILEDGKVGDEAGGSYKMEDGKKVALKLRFGPKPETEGKSKKAGMKKAQ